MVQTFNTPMQSETINFKTILLSTLPLNGPESIILVPLSDFVANSSNTMFSFSPKQPLQPNTEYYLTVTSGTKTVSGASVTGQFNFTTGDFIAPTVSIIQPSNGSTNISLSPIIQLKFSESVNNVNSNNITLHSGSTAGPTVAIGNITLGSNNTYTFSPSVNLSSNTTYYIVLNSNIVDNSGNALSQTSFNFTTEGITPSSYAYITNYDDSVTKCSIAANGDLIDCAHTGGTFIRPSGIAISPSKTHAYIITNSEDDPAVVTRCTIEPADGSLFDCNNTGATDIQYSSAIAIDSSGTFAYIANAYAGTVTSCLIDPVTANLSSCVDSGAAFSFPFGVALDQSATIAYVTNGSSATVSGCDIAGGTLSSCTSTDFSPLNNLRGIAINSAGNRAFIISNSNYLVSCPVTGKSIGLDCSSTQDALDSPYGVALNEDETIAYVVNYSNETVAKCRVGENGTLPGCIDSGATNIHGSNSIAIFTP